MTTLSNWTMNKKQMWRFTACKHHYTVYTFTEYHTVEVEIYKLHVAVLERNIPAPVSWLPSQVIYRYRWATPEMRKESHMRTSLTFYSIDLFFPLQDRKLQHNFKAFKYRLDHDLLLIYATTLKQNYSKLIKSIL